MDGKVLVETGTEQFQGRIEFINLPLLSGQYYFNVVTTDEENMQAYSLIEKAEPFEIKDAGPDFGLVRLSHRWVDRGPAES
jgi:hypothetical protein